MIYSGNYKECFINCEIILDYINKNNIKSPNDIYFHIYFSYYVSSFYINRNKSEEIIDKIFILLNKEDSFRNEYYKSKDFYDNQFKFVNHKNILIPLFLEIL